MKKNIDYYPHKSEAHRHPKFRMLRSTYNNSNEGWAAEGRFWALNNLIAQSEDCQIDLSKKRNMGVYADELGLSIEEFTEFISILTSEDVELLHEISPNIYTTDVVQETYTGVMTERGRNKTKYEKRKKAVEITENEVKKENNVVNDDFTPVNLYKRNKRELNKRELNKTKKEKPPHVEDIITNIWQRTFGRIPKIPERDETLTMLEKFGEEKTYKILKEATLLNFRSIKTLINALDVQGNIKPKDNKNGSNGKFDRESINDKWDNYSTNGSDFNIS